MPGGSGQVGFYTFACRRLVASGCSGQSEDLLRLTLGVVVGLMLCGLLLSTVPSFIPHGTPPVLATQL